MQLHHSDDVSLMIRMWNLINQIQYFLHISFIFRYRPQICVVCDNVFLYDFHITQNQRA